MFQFILDIPELYRQYPSTDTPLICHDIPMTFFLTTRRMARERRGAGSSVVSIETLYYKTKY
jgi:hypothetical protein